MSSKTLAITAIAIQTALGLTVVVLLLIAQAKDTSPTIVVQPAPVTVNAPLDCPYGRYLDVNNRVVCSRDPMSK